MIKNLLVGAMLNTSPSDSGKITNYEYKINEMILTIEDLHEWIRNDVENGTLDPRLGESTWRFTYDYPVVGERDISDLDDKDFVRLRRKKNKIILLMYSIVLVMFVSSMSLLSKFLLFFTS